VRPAIQPTERYRTHLLFDHLRQDLRLALRSLWHKPGISIVITITLSLGIGATAAIFSVVDSVLLKPLPFRDPGRLVNVWESKHRGDRYHRGDPHGFIIVRPATFTDWKAQSQSFESITSYYQHNVLLTGAGAAESEVAQEVDGDFFRTLGVEPILGRALEAGDVSSGAHVAVLSYSMWRRRFGSDPEIVGKTALIDNAPCTILGVMPAGFYPTRTGVPQLWLPLSMTPEERSSRTLWRLITFARLKPKVSFEQAQLEMDLISSRLEAAYPENYPDMSAVLTPVSDFLFSQYEQLMLVLLGAVALVLLIACANVANLLLGQAAERDHEFSLRAALGASPGRLIRQVITESLVLSGVGALLGIGLALVSVRPILALLPTGSEIPRMAEASVDWRVLLFTAGTALIAGLFFGTVPALRASRQNLNDMLKEQVRGGTAGATSRRVGDALIVSEVALSLVLLVGAGLLIRTFLALTKTEAGLNPERVVKLNVETPVFRYGKYEVGGANPSRAVLYETLRRKLETVPGVTSAAAMSLLPLRHGTNPWGIHIVGRSSPAISDREGRGSAGLTIDGEVSVERVTAGYFNTFGIPILRGRAIEARDAAGAPVVAVINELNAAKYFGGEDPIGRTIILDMTKYFPRATIVGVAADSRLNGVDQPVFPEVFLSIAQWPSAGCWVAVRTVAAPAGFENAIQDAVRQVDGDLVVSQLGTMTEVLGDSLWRQRLTAVLLGIFAGLAALLAAAGIYGVFSYLVTRRTREIGVRAALGASRRNLLVMVLGSALRLALIGIALGLVGTFALSRLIESWLYGVGHNDVTTISEVAALLMLLALLASYVPALRATRIDPSTALRQ
jgi:predicted permease